MAAGDDASEQIKLLEVSLSAIMVVFRGVVRLHGEVPPVDYSQLSAVVGAKAAFDPGPIQRAVTHVRGTQTIKKEEAQAVLAGYLAGMEKLASYLDRFTA
jgi:hypothetical protein